MHPPKSGAEPGIVAINEVFDEPTGQKLKPQAFDEPVPAHC